MPNRPIIVQAPADIRPATLLAGLLEEARQANPSDPGRVDRCLRAAMQLLGGVAETAGRGADPAKLSGLACWQTRRIEAHVAANLTGRLLVGELAAIVRLSISYFIRAFKVTFGVTPCAYIMGQRVARAKALMLSGDRPLAAVALSCGLADQAHFCRLFRRFEGQSPTAWRRRHAEGGSVPPRPARLQAASAPPPS